jgi:predicted nicotinamide N-methyase
VVRRNLEHTEAELRDLDAVVEGDVRYSAHMHLSLLAKVSRIMRAGPRINVTSPHG